MSKKNKKKNYILVIKLKKMCKNTKTINTLKRSKLTDDQLRNLLENNKISIKEFLLIKGK